MTAGGREDAFLGRPIFEFMFVQALHPSVCGGVRFVVRFRRAIKQRPQR